MSSATSALSKALLAAAVALGSAGCSEEQSKPAAASAQSATPPAPTPTPTPAAPAPTASATGPVHDCPAGSTGDGSLAKPCEAKGSARMMEVAWTGKTDDSGPHFRVTNKSPSVILWGKVVVYFYDKAGKQLDVKDSGGGKPKPSHTCSGNLFGGVMKPAEKAVIMFSCVKKDVVPDGTAQVEAEMVTVGFADASEKKSEYFWANHDLAPDKRPKGGVK